MSSLTTISSGLGMEESLEVEELVDTRLSLSLPIGAGSRQPPAAQELLAASPPPENQAPGKKRKVPEGGIVGSTTTSTRQHGKRVKTVPGGSDVDDNDGGGAAGGSGTRKKLRLTGEQAALMEKSFRAHNVLSHDEKQGLARRLGLKARQVEVWFQNRRARTKLKQTELDCDLLRRWCDRLSHENEQLRRDLAQARSSSSSSVLLSRLTAAAKVNPACPSCSKLAGSRASA